METGAITGYIDVAQLVLYGFWIFFAGLIIYLRREDKREGYPLESERSKHIKVQGFPAIPEPKAFELRDGRVVYAPRDETSAEVTSAKPIGPWPGAPLEPTGDPMLAGVGPGSASQRAHHPDLAANGQPKIQPMRAATAYSIATEDPDPRGMPVFGLDKRMAGTVTDAWIDIEEPQIRYLEVSLDQNISSATVLVPMPLARIDTRRKSVQVNSLRAEQFGNIPQVSADDRITLDEEERVVAYFGAGQLYATASRREPLL